MANKYKLIIIAVVIILVTIEFAGCYVYMTSNGYHLIYSKTNMKYIWVDKNGKP